MCLLCGETKEEGKSKFKFVANALTDLSSIYTNLYLGRIEPHTEEAGKLNEKVKNVIRLIAEDL